MKKTTLRALLALLLTGTVFTLGMPIMGTAMLLPTIKGTTYYVDSVGGSDDNAGTSQSAAWKSLAKINATTFQPGDKILLKSGGTWNGSLWPKGSGVLGSPILLGKYGGDALPHIIGNGTDTVVPLGTDPLAGQKYNPVVFLGDQDYWVIENLEVSSTATDDTNNIGIFLLTTGKTGQTRGLTVRGCYVHDIAASQEKNVKITGGIIAAGSTCWVDGNENESFEKKVGFDGVLIEGNHVKNVAKEGIRTTGHGDGGPFRNKRPHRNVVIRANYIEEIFGDGIVLSEVGGGGVVEYNVIRHFANTDVGDFNYAGCWTWQSTDAVFRYNEVFDGEFGYDKDNAGGYGDGEAFDFDIGSVGITFEYNFSHHNDGGTLLTMDGHGNRTNTFRYNISYNDGIGKYQQTFHVNPDNVRVYNNTIVLGAGQHTALFDGGKVGYFKNNIIAAVEGASIDWAWSNAKEGHIEGNIFYPASVAEGFSEQGRKKNIVADPKLKDVAGFEALYQSGYEIAPPTGDNIDAFVAALRTRAAYFQITEGSAAIGAGADIYTLPDTDFFGTSLKDGAPDIGAHQLGTQADRGWTKKVSGFFQTAADKIVFWYDHNVKYRFFGSKYM
ncbi:MAG: right-handed parallel beta-helix repeat-containing protein [Oscillospiraceae bacterium]|nr:right-handed parallel beta-helix repeat-containing protein [Oscillospiraceae bacterium]